MAKKARPRGRQAKAKPKAKASKRRGESVATRALGPVTLQEARALAGVAAEVPKTRAARARVAAARVPASPEALGVERKRLEKERELERLDPSLPPGQQIHQPRFDAALALVRAGYEDLVRLRDDLSPGTRLFFHSYDFAIPDGRGVCSHGPWLEPSLELRGVPDLVSRTAIVKELLLQFAGMLRTLVLDHPHNVSFVDTQGTLPPQKSSWHNELHPSKQGFKDVARVLHHALKAVFPARVL